MKASAPATERASRLTGVLLLYSAASLLHFAHNAEYLGDYPNLPDWLTRSGVYLAWCAQTAVGLLGYVLYRVGWRLIGLILLVIYASFGFDGLLHYTRAPFDAHTMAMNFTILFEVLAAGLLLVYILRLAVPAIEKRELPEGALLRRYLRSGAYADCYVTEIARQVTHAEYVAAFYTTPLFKLERLILAWLVARPSTDAQVQALAAGRLDAFAAWTVEARANDQLLLSDFRGRTRSWLMVEEARINGAPGARLYFGSAVVPVTDRKSGQATPGICFRALLGFHRLYSQALLQSAKSRLTRSRPD
jgi:hypothetical protein